MSVVIDRASMADVAEMAPQMRMGDINEARAEGFEPYAALEMSFALSGSQAWTVRREGKIMAMWGIVQIDLLNGVAVPWLLTTYEVDLHPKDFFKASREVLARLRGRYSLLWNRIDARYDKALRWARRVGFEVGPPVEAKGYKFCLITMRGA